MTAEEIETLVDEGVALVKRGEYEHGRALLMRAVEENERLEQAWMWLSVAMPDPEDKLTALDNVLIINPRNAVAAANARWWRQKLDEGTASDSRPAPTPELENESAEELYATSPPPRAEPSAAAPAESAASSFADALDEMDGVNDPHQCAWCGYPAEPRDRQCPHCGRSLLTHKERTARASPTLRSAVLLFAINGFLGLAESLGPIFALAVLAGEDAQPFHLLNRIGVFRLFFGDFLAYLRPEANLLLYLGFARAGLFLLLAVGTRARIRRVYFLGLLALIADVLWSGFSFVNSYGGWVALAVNALLGLSTMVVLFSAENDFGATTERLLTQPDRNAHGSLEFFRRGHAYRREEKWALAVAQWRQAVALLPTEATFYKDLGVGYAQIKRFDRAVAALSQAARLSPADKEIEEMIAIVKARQARHERQSGKRNWWE